MILTALEEYGLRCLLRTAQHTGEEPLRIAEIAEAEGLSAEYVAKLMRVLREGGLVTSTRGAKGGYHLARPAGEISIWDTLSVLGGRFFPGSFCDTHPGQRFECVHTTDCSIRALWRWIDGALQSSLSRVTLADLLQTEPGIHQVLRSNEIAQWPGVKR